MDVAYSILVLVLVALLVQLVGFCTSPTKALAQRTPSGVCMWVKYATGLSKAADFILSTNLPSEKDASATNVPCIIFFLFKDVKY